MTWGSLLAIYFVVWWTILFAVLPFGMRTQQEEGDVVLGSAASAPARPRLLRTALATSIVAAILVGAFWIAVDRFGFGLPMLAAWFDWRQ
jgi:predicted secreted protein